MNYVYIHKMGQPFEDYREEQLNLRIKDIWGSSLLTLIGEVVLILEAELHTEEPIDILYSWLFSRPLYFTNGLSQSFSRKLISRMQ